MVKESTNPTRVHAGRRDRSVRVRDTLLHSMGGSTKQGCISGNFNQQCPATVPSGPTRGGL